MLGAPDGCWAHLGDAGRAGAMLGAPAGCWAHPSHDPLFHTLISFAENKLYGYITSTPKPKWHVSAATVCVAAPATVAP